MVKLKDIGNFKSVPQIVGDIIKAYIPALDEYFSKRCGIEMGSSRGKYTTLSLLDIA